MALSLAGEIVWPHRVAAGVVVACLASSAIGAEWADPAKTLHVAFEVDVTGFDPAGTIDTYSNTIEDRIFDALYEWDYLARPYQLRPSLAAGMPSYSPDGKTWTIRLRPGIRFSDDAAFGGRRRELVAADVVYSWKRLMDPRVRSPSADLVRGKLEGLDAAAAKARAVGRFDYDTEVEGLRALDRYTIQLRLVEPDYTLLSYFSFWAMRIVAREVVERYADESGRVMDHPVGSNAFRLKSWVRGQKVVLEVNPGFREERYPDVPPDADAATRAAAAKMRDKRIPQIGQIEVAIIEEASPRLLLFNRGELDILNVPRELAPRVIDGTGRLLPQYAAKGVDVQRGTELSLAYTFFNMEDSVVGGYTPEKVALRRAICSAYAINDEIRLIRQGQAMPATQPIPPDIPGHVPGYRGFAPYDPVTARALLDRFGYLDRNGDGVRELPDGRPLVLRFGSEPDQTTRQYDELWQRSLAAVGLKVEFRKERWPELNKAAQAGQLQMWQLGLTSDTADYFMQQFYGPSSGEANLARFRNTDFDALFRQSRHTPEGPARTALYAKMIDIVAAYSPWCPNAFRISTTVAQPWVLGYRKNAHDFFPRWEYLDIDPRLKSGR